MIEYLELRLAFYLEYKLSLIIQYQVKCILKVASQYEGIKADFCKNQPPAFLTSRHYIFLFACFGKKLLLKYPCPLIAPFNQNCLSVA